MLETARLRLRRWLPADAAVFAAMNADPAVMEYFPAAISLEQTRTVIGLFEESFEKYGYGFWVVELKDGGAFVGSVGLEPYDLVANNREAATPDVAIGWQLAREHWGQGFAFEAAQAVRDFAKNQLKLNEIVCLMALQNKRSIRLCERLGMVSDTSQPHEDPNFPVGHPLKPRALYRLALR